MAPKSSYDLESDPNEWMNRADDAEMVDIKAELIARLPKYDAPDARGGETPGN